MLALQLASRARSTAAARASRLACQRVIAIRQMSTTAAQRARRPLSPHLTVYAFGHNMISSVLFRGAQAWSGSVFCAEAS